jgi:hypothetical protein
LERTPRCADLDQRAELRSGALNGKDVAYSGPAQSLIVLAVGSTIRSWGVSFQDRRLDLPLALRIESCMMTIIYEALRPQS